MHNNFENIVTLLGEEAAEVIALVEKEGGAAGVEFMRQWHQPGEGTIVSTQGNPWGPEDVVFEQDDYVLYYSKKRSVITLVVRIDLNI